MKHGEVVFRLFFPSNQKPTKAIDPGMSSFHHPPTCPMSGFQRQFAGFLAARPDMSGKSEFRERFANRVVIVSLVEAHPLRFFLGRFGTLDDDGVQRRLGEFHIVAVRAVNRETNRDAVAFRQQASFHPALAPVGRIGPDFFPTERGFRHRPVHAQPIPVDPFRFIERLDSGFPERQKDARLNPLLKPNMGRRFRAQVGLIQRLPLAAGSQHIEDRIRAGAIRHAWSSASKPMGIHMDWQQRFKNRPQLIGDSKSGRGRVVRGSFPRPFFRRGPLRHFLRNLFHHPVLAEIGFFG